MKHYTKADLEEIIMLQLENLNAIHDLLSIIKTQNELLHKANNKLKKAVIEFHEKRTVYLKGTRSHS